MNIDDFDKSDREKEIEQLIDNIITIKEWKQNMDSKILFLKNKYSKELEDYKFIYSIKKYNNIKKGGYIRYINLNDELRWGGILLKKYQDTNTNNHLMVLCNMEYKRFVISFEKNYIFYKTHKTRDDILRKIFLNSI